MQTMDLNWASLTAIILNYLVMSVSVAQDHGLQTLFTVAVNRVVAL
jgi:hypothetical protein